MDMPSKSDNPRKIVVVLGMHRSGTSALTRLLNLLGANVGTELIAAERDINDYGFWELKDVIEINERLLKLFDRPWYDIRPMPESWQFNDSTIEVIKHAADVLVEQFGNSKLVVLKDPRICRLFPFWKMVFDSLGWDVCCLHVIRHPYSVSRSLQKRDGLAEGTSGLLWLIYNLEIELHTQGLRRTIIDYDNALNDWNSVVCHLRETLFDENNSIENYESIEHLLENEFPVKLRHYEPTAFKVQNEITTWCETLYHSFNDVGDLNKKVDRIRSDVISFLRHETALIDILNETNRRLLDRTSDSIRIGDLHSHAQKVVLEREEYIAKLGNDAKERDAYIAKLSDTIKERDDYINKLSDTLKERDCQLENTNKQYMKLRTHWLVRLAIKQRIIET